jgi:hypothetical protein
MKPLFCLTFLLVTNCLIAQTTSEIIIPPYKDTYSELIKRMESGDTNIDYRKFRESFIESKQFIVASAEKKTFDSLKKEMYAQMKESNYPEILAITKAMLSINYTSLLAHKILRQTYKIIGDTINAKKYHDIQFGLLHSIVDNGNGKTCETSWPVIEISEEYFILEMINAKLLTQTLEGHCDKMEVQVDDNKKTYYFEISKVFEGYKKLGLN